MSYRLAVVDFRPFLARLLSAVALASVVAACQPNKVSGGDASDACSSANPTGTCPTGQSCQNGQCQTAGAECSAANPTGACPTGQTCQDGQCQTAPGAECSAGNPTGTCPTGQVCNAGSCVPIPPTCSDGTKDGYETDVDCGGSDCGKTCTLGKHCVGTGDCLGANVCIGGVCTAPACDDHLADGSETDVDCGGTCTTKCALAQGCHVDGDCAGGNVCSAAQQCVVPTCSDGKQDGNETDLDCGGGDCGKTCTLGKHCVGTGDCWDVNVCIGGVCTAPACDDHLKDGSETDVDCGGTCTAKCATDQGCLQTTDCVSPDVCIGFVCKAPTCSDTIQDGFESDVDCGGSVCGSSCQNGQTCNGDLDCQSLVCIFNVCSAPSCNDGRQDGNETGQDCGGPQCNPCAAAVECVFPSDCASDKCDPVTHQCLPATCDDGLKNGNETGIDCGGSCAALAVPQLCAVGTGCQGNGDCLSGLCQSGVCRDPGGGCSSDADCASGSCDTGSGVCLAPTCSDGVKNGDETGVDCGGACAALAVPQLCADGTGCTVNGDCTSGACLAGTCRPPECNDGLLNNGESGIDCGGPCAPCIVGGGCSSGAECASGVCDTINGVCLAPTCSDGVKNGEETGLDCGIVACNKECGTGQGCSTDWDCASHSCDLATHLCLASTCLDLRQNGSETGVDCGGGTCPDCGTGGGCSSGQDCVSGVCSGSPATCQAATCSDGVKNGNETAIDCGGDCAALAVPQLCGDGAACTVNGDCASKVCTGGICQAATCSDGVKNGNETAVDCGGACAALAVPQLCGDGAGCSVNGDCASKVCTGGICQAATCSDTVQNGNETGVDCGGDCAALAVPQLCADGAGCATGGDCQSGVCDGSSLVCLAPTCSDGVKNGEETDIDCGGTVCQGCGDGKHCVGDGDCAALTLCIGEVCVAASCANHVKDSTETDVDCGGTCTAQCGTGAGCLQVSDCLSGVCNDGTAGPTTCTTYTPCCQLPTCSDLVKNGTETGVDCGAAACGNTCPVGQGCDSGLDCQTGVCSGSPATCQAATCTDGVKNGGESAIDCGGSGSCDRCGTGKTCTLPSDCASKVCTGGICQAATCSDGVQNGYETAMDCGGADCGPTCGTGQTCNLGSDCVNGVCSGSPKICQPPVCGDGIKQSGEACDEGTNGCGTGCSADCQTVLTGCGDGVVCGAEACDPGSNPPASWNLAGMDCSKFSGSGTGAGTLGCNADCTFNLSSCTGVCGNLAIDQTYEVCDGTNLNGKDCTDFGGTSGTPTCGTDCNTFDLTPCVNTCGNGIIDTGVGEVCDGTDVGGLTCASYGGSASQPVGCSTDCLTFDLSKCAGICGNGTVDSGEQCDGAQLGAKTTCTQLSVCIGGSTGTLCTSDADCSGGTCTPFAGGTLGCKGNCGYDVSQCYVCGDNRKSGTEMCDGTDLGTPAQTCVSQGFSGGTLACSPTCTFVTSGCTVCGNGTIDAGEVCDSNNLGTPAATCTSISACSAGDAGKIGKACTGAGDCGTGGVCTAGYFSGGTLACGGTCGTFDTSGCQRCDASACSTAGGSCVNGVCQCPLYKTFCNGTCVDLKSDPNNCGGCGPTAPYVCNVGGGQVCSSGVCTTTCQTPLVSCSGQCVDTQTSNTHCGGCPGTNCTTLGQVCNAGLCGAPKATVGTPAKYASSCPPMDLNLGTTTPPVPPSMSCTGDLASVSFRWALCSCGDIGVPNSINSPIFTDGFDSRKGPYSPTCEGVPVDQGGTPCVQSSATSYTSGTCTQNLNNDGIATCVGAKGAGMGADRSFNATSGSWIVSQGAVWWAGTTSGVGNITAEQEIHVGSTLSGAVHGRGDAYVTDNISATGGITGKLHLSNGKSYGSFGFGSIDQSQAIVVPEPCDCSATKLINVVGLVNQHACTNSHCIGGSNDGKPCTAGCTGGVCGGTGAAKCYGDNNDNYAANLSPDVFNSSAGGRIDLPCGMYYLSTVNPSGGNVTIVAQSRTVIFVGGDINLGSSSKLYIEPGPSAEVDVFAKGGLCLNGDNQIGSPQYPARTRFYVSGGDLCTGLTSGQCANKNGCSWTGTACVSTGSGAAACAQKAVRALDLGLFSAAANVYAPWGAVYAPKTLAMYGGLLVGNYLVTQDTAIHFDTGVVDAGKTCPSSCGNGKLDAGELCDGSALGGQTCQTRGFDGGTLLCNSTCDGFVTTDCFKCGDQKINGSEQCEPSPQNLGGATCSSIGYPGGGTLTCRPDCRFDTTGCCGDGIIGTGEQCEQGNLNGATCQSQGFTGGTLGCSSTCQYDTSQCSSCGNGVIEWPEQCEVGNLGGDTCVSLGYVGGILSCTANCLLDTSACTSEGICGNGTTEKGEQCDDKNAIDTDNCRNNCTLPVCGDGVVSILATGSYSEQCDPNAASNTLNCADRGMGTGLITCSSTCQWDTSACVVCGDGKISGTEQCEPSLPLGQTCQGLGHTGGTLSCNATTCQYDASACTDYSCGGDHAAIEGPEQCDYDNTTSPATVNVNGQTCSSVSVCVGGTAAGRVCNGAGDCPSGTCTGSYYAGGTALSCNADCTLNASGCYRCGDGAINSGEACDPGTPGTSSPALGGRTCTSSYCAGGTNAGRACTTGTDCPGSTCTASTFAGGTISCNSNCTFNTSGCSLCGNGIINAPEACDGSSFGTATCANISICEGGSASGHVCSGAGDCPGGTCTPNYYNGGTLKCSASCTLDTSSCTTSATSCGNGSIDGGEQCDPGSNPPTTWNLNGQTCASVVGAGSTGTLGCNANCTFNTTACCGDGVKASSEICDGSQLGGATCTSSTCTGGTKAGFLCTSGTDCPGGTCTPSSFTGGTLGCTPTCGYDTSGCTQCSSCRDCNNQACVSGQCGACVNDSDCCAPLVCVFGQCVLY